MPVITQRAQCSDWLRGRLLAGPVDYEELSREAKQLNFSRSTLQRASCFLGVIKRFHKTYPGGHTSWALPEE